MTDTPAIGTVTRLSERALDAAVGGASLALDAVSDQKAARRRGSRINAKVAGNVETAATELVTLPERVLFSGLRALRTRAGRSDVTGVAARNLLLLVHRPAAGGARVLERIEKETAPPARRTRRTTSTTAGVRRAATTATRRAATGARRVAAATTGTTGTRRTTGRGRRSA
ncbi:MAG: hypothetical protein QOE72_2502 [Chloroflexota bacterium]|nr:hypothetical protein [Chloroflexota bacterium]